jgi:hypothetical protein
MFEVALVAALDEPPQPLSAIAPTPATASAPAPVRRTLAPPRRAAARMARGVGPVKVGLSSGSDSLALGSAGDLDRAKRR